VLGLLYAEPAVTPTPIGTRYPVHRFELDGTFLQGAQLLAGGSMKESDAGTRRIICRDDAPGIEVFLDDGEFLRGEDSPEVVGWIDDQIVFSGIVTDVSGDPVKRTVTLECTDKTISALNQVIGSLPPDDPEEEDPTEEEEPSLLPPLSTWSGKNVNKSGSANSVTISCGDDKTAGADRFVSISFSASPTYDTTYQFDVKADVPLGVKRPPQDGLVIRVTDAAEPDKDFAFNTGFDTGLFWRKARLGQSVTVPKGETIDGVVEVWAPPDPDPAITFYDMKMTASKPPAAKEADVEVPSETTTVADALQDGSDRSLEFFAVFKINDTDLIDLGKVGTKTQTLVSTAIAEKCGRNPKATVEWRWRPEVFAAEVAKKGTLGVERTDITIECGPSAARIVGWKAGSTGAASDVIARAGQDLFRATKPKRRRWAAVTDVPAVVTDAGIVAVLQPIALSTLAATSDTSEYETTIVMSTPPGGRCPADWLLDVGVEGDHFYRRRLRVCDRIPGVIDHGSIYIEKVFRVIELADTPDGKLTMTVV